jgi:hypothetical protein
MVVFGNAADAVEFAMVLQLALVRDVPWASLAAAAPPRPSVARATHSSGRVAGDDPFDTFYRFFSSASASSDGAALPSSSQQSTGDGSALQQQQRQQRQKLWAGLRTRTGIASGVAAVSTDPLTGAFDYGGRAVDTAARVCLIARGGQTVMAEASLRAALAHIGLEPGNPNPPSAPTPPPRQPWPRPLPPLTRVACDPTHRR